MSVLLLHADQSFLSPDSYIYTIPEGFTENDEILMKAKINFTATVVGDYPNVIKFLGAVVDDARSTYLLNLVNTFNFQSGYRNIIFEWSIG